MRRILHHMAVHTWTWVCALFAVGAVAIYAGFTTPASLFFMFAGLLMMMRSEGTSLEHIVEADPLSGEDAPEEEERETQAA